MREVWLGVAAAVLALSTGCGQSQSGGSSGETHFVRCEDDRDCSALGSNYRCEKMRCVPADAGVAPDASLRSWPDAAAPRWRNASEPYCGTAGMAFAGPHVWSDQRGVFVLDSTSESKLFFNDGSDWTEIQATLPSMLGGLTGFPGGALVLYGDGGCSVRFLMDGTLACSAATPDIGHAFVVDEALAYGVGSERVYAYDGSIWTQLGEPLGEPDIAYAWAAWASRDVLLVAGQNGMLLVSRDGAPLERQAELTGAHYHTAWGFDDALFAGARDGTLASFDGSTWSAIAHSVTACDDGGVKGLWGADGQLFFHTDTGIGLWDGVRARTLAQWECDDRIEVTSVWGNSTSEVFFAARDRARSESGCGTGVLLWYDGESFGAL